MSLKVISVTKESALNPLETLLEHNESAESGLITHYDFLLRILLVGDSGVGKSSLVQRLAANRFPELHYNTIGVDFEVMSFNIRGKNVKVQLWDTAGQERFRAVTKNYYRRADAVIMVYDIVNTRSFANLKIWSDEITNHAHSDIKVFVVGNKLDLTGEVETVVDTEEAAEFAARHNNAQLIQVSAKSGVNVSEAFQDILECLVVRKMALIRAAAKGSIEAIRELQHMSLDPSSNAILKTPRVSSGSRIDDRRNSTVSLAEEKSKCC